MFGWILPAWVKFTVIAGILSAAIYTIQDYKSLARTVERQKNDIARLNNNLKTQATLVLLNKEALTSLSGECQKAADRFLKENDIWQKINESADPLTDAANFATEPPEDRKEGP